jgi:nitroreductase
MKRSLHRRLFLKTSALLGGGLFLLKSGSMQLFAAEKPTDTLDKQTLPPNDTIRTIRNLRTVHGNFLDKEIPDATIEEILQSSIRAANASNTQSYSIIVVKDRQKMKDICTYQGSCMLLYCVDYTRLNASAEHLGHSYFKDNMEDFVTSSINTALAAQTAAIAAKSLGIDYLLTNGIHRGDMERLWKILDLPRTRCFPLIALVLGYPTAEPNHKKGRLDGKGVIHYEKYHTLTNEELDEITRKYDDDQLHIALNENWRNEGYTHYLDWLFQAWANSPKPTDHETQMFRFLKRSGFVDMQKS